MSSNFYFNITESFGSGIDFFGSADKLIGVEIFANSDVTVSAYKIALGSAQININGATVVVSLEEVLASSNISITSNVQATAYEIQYASSAINSTTLVSAVGTNIELATINILNTSSVSAIVNKTAFGSSNINIVSTVDTVARRIRFASAQINALSVTVAVLREILNASINISGPKASIIATAIKFSQSDIVDDSFFKTLYLLDGKPLTNHGRTSSSEISPVFVENRNWNAQKSRYYKKVSTAGRKNFNLSWSNVPNSRYDTVDYRYARDYIKKLAEDPDVHTLTVLNDNSNGTTPYTETTYNVYIRDYSESLVRRDISNEIYLWECNLTLEEA